MLKLGPPLRVFGIQKWIENSRPSDVPLFVLCPPQVCVSVNCGWRVGRRRVPAAERTSRKRTVCTFFIIGRNQEEQQVEDECNMSQLAAARVGKSFVCCGFSSVGVSLR